MGSRQTLSYDVNGKRRAAFHLIILLGIVSLFGDITYEGARSITGPYLALLGASAGIVGLVSGLGEFVGYAFRLVSGYLADRTQAYWTLTIIGYGLILSIPLLAFAGQWQLAAAQRSLSVMDGNSHCWNTTGRHLAFLHTLGRLCAAVPVACAL